MNKSTTEWVWMDGELVPWNDATVHVTTHTLHYGMGVFEGVRVYETSKGPAIFRLKEHTRRLVDSMHIFNMDCPYDYDAILEAQITTFKKNGLKSGYLRPMAFYGSESLGIRASNLKVHLSVCALPWGSYLGQDKLENGIRVCVSSYSRAHVNSQMCKAKASGHYVNSMLALSEAIRAGCDEAILLDTNGFVMEGSGENIFIVKNGQVFTPDLTSAIEGITRSSVISILKDKNIPCAEKRITRDELYIADEVFLVGTAAEILPVSEVDGRKIGNGTRGNITKDLQTEYFKIVVGENEKYQHWVTYV